MFIISAFSKVLKPGISKDESIRNSVTFIKLYSATSPLSDPSPTLRGTRTSPA